MHFRFRFFFAFFLCASGSALLLPCLGFAEVQKPELLTLARAIDRALSHNLDLEEQTLNLRNYEINYQNTWETYYLPQFSLNANSSSSKTVGYLPGTPSTRNQGYPASSLGLTLGEYTLYNFGRDKAQVDQAKLDFTRYQEMLEESKRAIKFQVINSFWDLKSRVNKLEAYQRSVEIAQAIVSLQESRVSLGKATWADVSSSNVDLLNTRNLRDQAESDAHGALFTLNVLLGDPVGTPYRIEDEINFLPIKVTEEILYQTYLSESPNMKTAKKELLKSEIALTLAEKTLMPLPTIKFSGVSLGYGNNYNGTRSGLYSNSNVAQNNLDVSATVSLSVPLTGPGGLFGKRTIEASQIQVDINELHLKNISNKDRQSIFQFVQNIKQFELTVINNREKYKNGMVVLQSVLDSFLTTSAVSRLDIKDAINQARDSEISLNDSIIQHLSYKTQLAAFIGVDFLPRME